MQISKIAHSTTPLSAWLWRLFAGLFAITLSPASLASSLDTVARPVTIDNAGALGVVRGLRANSGVDISFISSGSHVRAPFASPEATVKVVLDQLVRFDHTYAYSVIDGHIVVHPVADDLKAEVESPKIYNVPRLKAARQYIQYLRGQVPAYADLVDVPAFGATSTDFFTSPVSVDRRGPVVSHFIQLIGRDGVGAFEIVETAAGVRIFQFVPAVGRGASEVGQSAPCDHCVPTDLYWSKTPLAPHEAGMPCDIDAPEPRCFAGVKINFTGLAVDEPCSCQGALLTEHLDIVSSTCGPFLVVAGLGCLVGENSSLPGCMDEHSACVKITTLPQGKCDMVVDQELRLCGRTLRTVRVTYTFVREGDDCVFSAVDYAVVATFPAEPMNCGCPWDLDGDGTVGNSDLALLLSVWGTPRPGGGVYGSDDLASLLTNWGPCPE